MGGNIVVPSCNLTFDFTEIANESESHYLLESNYSQHKQQQHNTTTQPNIVHTAARKLVWSAPNNQSYIEMFLEFLQTMGEDFCLGSWSLPSNFSLKFCERNLNSWSFPSSCSREYLERNLNSWSFPSS